MRVARDLRGKGILIKDGFCKGKIFSKLFDMNVAIETNCSVYKEDVIGKIVEEESKRAVQNLWKNRIQSTESKIRAQRRRNQLL